MQHTQSSLEDLARYYVQSSLAGGVLSVLARCRRDRRLTDQDRRVLGGAEEFLRRLEEGDKFRRGNETSPRFLQGGITLEESLAAIPEGEGGDISAYLSRLRKFVGELAADPVAKMDSPPFDHLQEFMKRYRALQRSLITESLEATHMPGATLPVT
mgnify:CR=1 FL=1